LLAVGYSCGALTALLFILQINQVLPLAIAFALGGVYVGIEETLEDALAAELLPKDLRGTGFGTLALVNGIGDSVSSLAVGWLWTAFSPAAGFGFAFLLMAAGALFMWTIRNSRRD
jgi:sugar phosphate permease